MQTYRVNSLSLNLGGRKIFNSGDIISDRDLRNSNTEYLIKNGFIEREKIFVRSNNIEFGYELIASLPYAYYLYVNNRLLGTESATDTKPLYFFSENHTENNVPRSFNNTHIAKLPNIKIHTNKLSEEMFLPPPLKEKYKNDLFKFDKPILCICNRVTSEWLGEPVNYFDNECLDKLFSMLKKKYEIIYFNIKGKPEYYDHQIPVETGEEKVIKKHNIKTIHQIYEQNNIQSFNECQLMVLASCDKFITMNGGYGILSSYMGGTNIIYSKKCREITPEVNSFYRWYHKFGGSRIIHLDNYVDLFEKVKSIFVKEEPLINVLIRTSGRPNYFKECIKSVYSQSCHNYNIIVGCDDEQSEQYVQPHKCRIVRYERSSKYFPKKNEYGYGRVARYNLYINELHKEVKEGYILYLDDDDILNNKDTLKIISENIKTENDLLFFRVQFPNKIVPSNENFGKAPVLCDIDTVGFCFHHKYCVDWEAYKMGDYRVATKLWETVPNKIFINRILTKINRKVANGFGRRDDL
jgi:hypothetical protein